MNIFLRPLLILIFSIFVSGILIARDHSPKLLVKYTIEELKQLESDSPDQFELLNYFVEDGFYFMEMPEKQIEYELLKKIDAVTGAFVEDYVITEKDISEFNPLNYNCIFRDLKRSYYKVGETGMLLVIPSTNDLRIALDNKKRLEIK